MGLQKIINELVDELKDGGVYAFCDHCVEQTYVDELETEQERAYGICNECFNTVTVSIDDLQHKGKSF